MKVVLSPKANSDRVGRLIYLDQFSRATADRTNAQIREYLLLLQSQSHLGRPGRVDGTREFLIGRTGLIAIYRVETDRVWILRILHGAQDWPARF